MGDFHDVVFYISFTANETWNYGPSTKLEWSPRSWLGQVR